MHDLLVITQQNCHHNLISNDSHDVRIVIPRPWNLENSEPDAIDRSRMRFDLGAQLWRDTIFIQAKIYVH